MDCGRKIVDRAKYLPTLHGALSVSAKALELILEASVIEESLLRSDRRLCFEPKNVLLLLTFGDESDEELGDCDFLLLIFVLFIKGIQTIFVTFLLLLEYLVRVEQRLL